MPRDTDDAIDVPATLERAREMPQNLMLLKMENESMMSAAVARPREPAKIVKQLIELIEAYPAAADDAIYSKPIGKVNKIECGGCPRTYEVPAKKRDKECPHCGSRKIKSERVVQKFAEGLSIRAAESIRAIYGFTRLATTTEVLPNGSAKLTGTFVDYAAGNMTSDERIISPWYKTWDGKMEQTAEDRFLGIVVKAEKAKLRRDIILDSVPNIVKAAFTDACEKKLVAMVAPEIVMNTIVPYFAERGVTLEALEKIVGRTLKLGWSEEDRLRLKKIANGLKNEEITVAELLADIENPGGETGGGKVSESDLNKKYGAGKKPEGADEGKKPAEGEGTVTPAAEAGGTVEGANTDVRKPDDQPAVEIPVDWDAKLGEIETEEHCDKGFDLLEADKTVNDAQRTKIYESLLAKKREIKKAAKKK